MGCGHGSGGWGWGVGYSIFMQGRSGMTIGYIPSHPYYAGTEHVGFSPTRQTLRAPSARDGAGKVGHGMVSHLLRHASSMATSGRMSE